jgi:hypothetical protein
MPARRAQHRCVVAQCPVFGASLPEIEPSEHVLETIRQTLQSGDIRGGPDCTTGPLPVVSFDPSSDASKKIT